MNPGRWIDRNDACVALVDACDEKSLVKTLSADEIREVLSSLPPAKVTSCRKCGNYKAEEGWCRNWGAKVDEDEFCSRAEGEAYVPEKWNKVRGKC